MKRSATLRTWLNYLRETGQLKIVTRRVSPVFEVSAVAKMFDGKCAVYAANVDGYSMPIVTGTATTREQFAEALGLPKEKVVEKFLEAIDNPVPVRPVDSKEAPVHENVITEGIDLMGMLPVPKHHEKDAGHYITAGLAIVKDPETKKQNVAILRLQVTGKNRLGVYILPRHTFHYYKMAEEKGQPLEIAIVIGVDPVLLLASQALGPLQMDELEVAGALKGEPIPVVRCKTVDIDVPAHAEIVLEGRVLPHVREPEGPFGEFPKYYGAQSNKEVIEIDCITHRNKPIYQNILAGSYENLLLGAIPREAGLLRSLRQTCPTVKAVHLTLGGVCRYHLVISMKKRNEGEAKNVLMAAFAGHYDVKHAIVVDEDVDIFDMEQVEWALGTRFQADRDLIVVNYALGSKLDPSANNGVSSKLGFDCTIPLDQRDSERYLVTRIPGYESLDVNEYVQDGGEAAVEEEHFR